MNVITLNGKFHVYVNNQEVANFRSFTRLVEYISIMLVTGKLK